MKTKLLKNHYVAIVAILCTSLANYSINAQSVISINKTTTPTTANAGETITANLLYTLNAGTNIANPGGTLSLQLNLVDPNVLDQYGNASEELVAGGAVYVTNLAVAATETAYPLEITLGNSTITPSISLTEGKYYVLRAAIFEHNTGNDWDWKGSDASPITINTSVVVSYSNVFSDTSEQTKAEGTTITGTVKYTAPELSKIIFKLERLTGYPSAWKEDDIEGTTVVIENLAPTGSGVIATQEYTLTIPAGTLANYPLGTDQSYQVVAVLRDMAEVKWIDTRKKLNITSALSIDSFNKQNANLIVQNPVKETLRLNNENDFKSVSIYDITGKMILKTNKEKVANGIDVSSLTKGVYLIVTDNNLKSKFIKE